MTTATQHIEVWHDETSDPKARYCVSLCDADGSEVRCLSSHDTRGQAVKAGRAAALERDMLCLYRETDGRIKQID